MQTTKTVGLVRAVSWIGLMAIALNGMIGAGIFALPATAAHLLGSMSPVAYLSAGLVVVLIALCFAEAGSLFDHSGGPYLYARSAFGPFVGFEMGWMFCLARLTSVAAISNTFCSYLGYFWPASVNASSRFIIITLLIGILTAIHCRGVRSGVLVLNVLTVGKLVPLILFCLLGFFFLDAKAFTAVPIEPAQLAKTSLLLLFAFGGFEFASVPSGEVVQTKRILPLVLLGSVAIVVVLYLSIQVVAVGLLPGLATSTAPLAQAASRVIGPAGGLFLAAGALFSTTGTASASILVGSRMLHALAEGGLLPAPVARVHKSYRTPVAAVILFAAVSWAFAISGTFAQLAAVSALSRLLYYVATCLAIPVLRRKMPNMARGFRLPGGLLVPVLALLVCAWLISGSSSHEWLVTSAALALGALIYAGVVYFKVTAVVVPE